MTNDNRQMQETAENCFACMMQEMLNFRPYLIFISIFFLHFIVRNQESSIKCNQLYL